MYVTKSISPGGIASAFYSDHMGRNIRNISSGLMTEKEYDASGKVILTRSGAENGVCPKTVTLSLYNQTGDLTHTIRNPRYDATGKVWKADNEESIVTSNTYDAQGNCLTETDAEGHVTTHVYDKASRLAGTSWQDGTGSANTVSYAYDILEPDGTVSTRTTDAKGNSSKVYTNENGNQVKTANLGNGSVTPISTAYEHDLRGNITRETSANGSYKKYEYDGKNRLIKVTHYKAARP